MTYRSWRHYIFALFTKTAQWKIANKLPRTRCMSKLNISLFGFGLFLFLPSYCLYLQLFAEKKILSPYTEQQDRIECFPQQLNCSPQRLESENLCARNLRCEAAKYRSGKKFKIQRQNISIFFNQNFFCISLM